jgi:hypothetical protein
MRIRIRIFAFYADPDTPLYADPDTPPYQGMRTEPSRLQGEKVPYGTWLLSIVTECGTYMKVLSKLGQQ